MKGKTVIYKGIPSSPGISIGIVTTVNPPVDIEAIPTRHVEDVDAEIQNFKSALQEVRREIKELSRILGDNLTKEEGAVFDAYIKILSKEGLAHKVIKFIKKGYWAPTALQKVMQIHILRLEMVDDPYLKERASDIKDLVARILLHLTEDQKTQFTLNEKCILVGPEITIAKLIEVSTEYLAGIISTKGTHYSHVAILARALGIPAVMGVEDLFLENLVNKRVIVNGTTGEIILAPSAKQIKKFVTLQEKELASNKKLEFLKDLPAITRDGFKLPLYINAEFTTDFSHDGAEGVGLYRSEIPFMLSDHFPEEEEQRLIYRELLENFTPKPVMIRTLDIGGDKTLSYFPVEENNPFLGWRGIRISLDFPEIFLQQIRAMLQASEGLENLHILLPMITTLTELDNALTHIRQTYNALLLENFSVVFPKVGVMVEVPSTIFIIKEIAEKVDFISVGSNDLVQYLLAVDRNNPRVSHLYDFCHPSVIRALAQVVNYVHNEGKQISLCGEMATDPIGILILLALDFDMLSINPNSLPRVKWIIRNLNHKNAKILLAEIMLMKTREEIRAHIKQAMFQSGLENLFHQDKK